MLGTTQAILFVLNLNLILSLQKSGFLAFFVGMLISVVFGFIFGLIVGTTQMPWGLGDWPTEEMRGRWFIEFWILKMDSSSCFRGNFYFSLFRFRGNARSLWMGIAWALTSGTGVALALLLGATGPMIGVAISASLLPPVVNCVSIATLSTRNKWFPLHGTREINCVHFITHNWLWLNYRVRCRKWHLKIISNCSITCVPINPFCARYSFHNFIECPSLQHHSYENS